MPPKKSQAFKLAKASILGRTTTRSDGDSVEGSTDTLLSVPVQRQLYLPSSSSPTTPDATHLQTEMSTYTSGPPALDIRINSRRIHREPTEEPVSMVHEDDLQQQLAERDEEIRVLKERQIEAKKEADEEIRVLKETQEKQGKMMESMMAMFRASDANSNSTTPTSHNIG